MIEKFNEKSKVKADVERFFEILHELFFGKDAALVKYAKVRRTQYEMRLYRDRGYHLEEIDLKSRLYFAKAFLPKDVTIRTATPEQMRNAYERLGHAVNDGCHGKCLRLVKEMNNILGDNGLAKLEDPESFLKYFTAFWPEKKDQFGDTIYEPGHNEPVLEFKDGEAREEFKRELKNLERDKLMLDMVTIGKIVVKKRKGVRI
ncbi:hypothetical protein J5491_01680 [Candidatus Saccharibacteria bacterium]|nr:hypothetical protein [Candidatus Saccharibacteria bacterium]